MRILMWIIVIIVLVGGLFWFFSSSDTAQSNESQNQESASIDSLSENGRIIDTEDQVINEIEDALAGLE